MRGRARRRFGIRCGYEVGAGHLIILSIIFEEKGSMVGRKGDVPHHDVHRDARMLPMAVRLHAFMHHMAHEVHKQ